ncbi:hypothetical protein GV794_05200 [Nocardia cyriacigeorgica]|uniref:EamA family transporter n=1 Tax=Nocardia cyriacigeorgica TaxID=135487 RepID=A0ABX0CGE6_9NOCA|nr:hypothetical protein [Nocardia cyriacigeorgica]NEW37651.1 hypothetical protein [Nocardia cyriacigeorgica]NEW48961.1 hypothetical protein [Nocardia cyriacigeorgica]NEW55062.1 hypothetical protein [Nocardia cyriacigeorgica]
MLNTTTQLGQVLGISSLAFFGRLDHGTALPDAFAYSLRYVAAFVIVFTLPLTVRNRRSAPQPTGGVSS